MRLLLLLAATTTAVAPLTAQSLSPADTRRIDSVFAAFDGTSRPGCSLGVSRNGTPVYLRGYGMADLQHGVPIGPTSIFHVASVSKQFAAAAVALLAQDGKLSLDDPVRKYVPELPDYGTPVTIRHLVNHTSGIRDHWELLGLAGWRYPDDVFTQADVLDIVSRQKALNFKPGDEYLYSNSGYALLAFIVERVSGKTLRAFSDERIFQPLGMTRTHVHDDHTMIVPGRTSAYQRDGDGWRMSVPQFDTHGATSLFTTPGDLLKWQQNFVTGTVGGTALMREAETSALLNDGKPANYGYGISVDRYRGTEAFGHGGADAGYRADVVRFPAYDLAVAVACNFAEAVPGRYARAVGDVLVGDRLEPVAAPSTGSTVAVSAARLAQVAGVYASPVSDQAYRFEVREGKLVLANFGATLEARSPSEFSLGGVSAFFDGPPDRVPARVRLVQGRTTLDSMPRLPAFAPNAEQEGEYLGEYWSDELRVGYRVERGDTGLVLRMFKHGVMPMRPIYADAYLAQRAGTVRFLRTRGRVTGFRVTGGRVRNVLFSKGAGRP